MNNLDPWVSRNDIETDDIPILPAATMILVDNRPDLKVLMLLRNNNSGFVASHTIFPGGAIEHDDRSYKWNDLKRSMQQWLTTSTRILEGYDKN